MQSGGNIIQVVSHMDRRRERAGFSLVELLVVIGIIGVLIAILLPALTRAREASKQIKCSSNMRQVGAAIMMYVSENKGMLPIQTCDFNLSSGPTYYGVADFANPAVYGSYSSAFSTPYASLINQSVLGSLLAYLPNATIPGGNNVFVCPTAEDNYPSFTAPSTAYSSTSYLPNGAVFGRWKGLYPTVTFAGRRITDILNSAAIIGIQETDYADENCTPRPTCNEKGNYSSSNYSQWCLWNSNVPPTSVWSSLHSQGGNFLMMDGHVEWRLASSLHAVDFGLGMYNAAAPAPPGLPTDISSATSAGTLYRSLFDY